MIKCEDPLAHRRLKGTMDVFLQHCDEYLRMYPGLQTGAGAGKTALDKHRMKSCRAFLVIILLLTFFMEYRLHSLTIDLMVIIMYVFL